jgi:hypothetical protein
VPISTKLLMLIGIVVQRNVIAMTQGMQFLHEFV